MDAWIEQCAAEIARRAPRELEALGAVSSPSGDVHGAEECASVCAALLPDAAQIERVPCSSPEHAKDLIARLTGTGAKRVLLLGHVDTVVAHAQHRPLARDGEQLVGSGAVDMKGGVVLAIAAMRAFAQRPQDYAELSLLLVCDEEWRAAPFTHVERLAGIDPRLGFEGRELAGPAGGAGGCRRGRGRRGPPQGGRDDPGPRARAHRALGIGARPRPERPAGARRR